jgi:MAF protein
MILPTLILASNSPRRRQLLAWTGWNFTVSAAEIDETPLPGEAPVPYVSRLAFAKGEALAHQAPAGSLILAADTIVADGPLLLGKPAGPAEAYRILQRLRGRTHQVYTAIAVIEAGSERASSDLCCADVPMRSYSDLEIETYIASGDPLDKAGAYAIQHAGFHPVENFAGCYACVMGLPLCHLARIMTRLGYPSPNLVPVTCQANLGYACPIYSTIVTTQPGG